MKKIILFFVCTIFVSACNKQPSIVGEWISEDNYGSKQTIIFKEDKSMIVIKNNRVEDFDFEDKTLKYEVDNSKKPCWFDMIIYDDKNHEEIMRIKGLYEFLSENTFRLCINGGQRNLEESLQRPSSFEKRNTTIFTRR